MTSDVDTLWALFAGVLLLFMAIGVIAVIEGLTRQRSVSSGVARHIGAVAGAIIGSVLANVIADVGVGGDVDRWLRVVSAVLFATIALGSLAERATFGSHVVLGVFAGLVFIPVSVSVREPGGLLASISIGTDPFLDGAAATLFSAAGWFALVGATVIGPRRGWVGEDGHVRSVPGKSMATALGGAIVIVVCSSGLLSLPAQPWSSEHVRAATLMLLASAGGVIVSAVLGWQMAGSVRTPAITSGAIGGLVAACGAPLELSEARAVAAGVAGALAVAAGSKLLAHLKIDDPAAIVSTFGASGVVGSLLVATSMSSLVAQLVGVLIIAAASTVCAGVVFGGLRIVRQLRIPADIEVVGLDR